MERKKPPSKGKYSRDKRERVEFIINSLSHGWLPQERETGILFSHEEQRVYLETSYPSTARRWFENLWGDPNVEWSTKSDTLKISIPWEYCRSADLVIKPKYREYNENE